jgi:hypothetical protein
MGPLKGMPEMARAAEAPSSAGMSGSISGSRDSTVTMIWTSFMKPLGNRGRSGRSMSRQVRVFLLAGRPSRLKKPPGILPAA